MKKKIELKSITLSNWRGQNHTITFGDTTMISGRNGSGKSSIMKAFYWLLTSYPCPTETKNFNLFDNREAISPETPKACVKAVVNVDGFDYILERKAVAKFTRKRGSNEMVKDSSDTYELYIDNVEVSATNFNNWINDNLCPVDQLVYCIDGGFFTELLAGDKNKARKVLETVVGEIKDEDMKGDYSVLEEDLKRFSVDAIEERTKAELRPWRDRLTEIPAIIEDKEKTLSEYMAIDFEAILAEINKAKEDIEDIDNAILGKGKEIEPIMGERNRILSLINEKCLAMQESKRVYYANETAKIASLKNELTTIAADNSAIQSRNIAREAEYMSNIKLLEQRQRYLLTLVQTRERLLAERDEVKARVFEADTCSYCGQPLPVEMVEASRAKFNAKKTEELNSIVTKGRLNNEVIEETRADISRITSLIEKGFEKEPLKDDSEIEKAYAKAQAAIIPFENTELYAVLNKEIKDLEASMPEVPKSDNESLVSAKRALMLTLENLNRRYGLKSKADEIRGYIEDLKKELRRVGSEIARLEGKIDKCKEYMQEKADIISYRVNGKLNDCVIDMWSAQKDGTLVPDVVLRGKNGVRFGSLNFSDQIKTRIEMQRLFMRHYGIGLPLFVDEATVFDSTNKPAFENQTVFLYASDSPFLTVENGN